MPSPFSTVSQQIRGKMKDIEIVGNGFLWPRIIMFDKIKRPRQIHSPRNSKENKKSNKLLTTQLNLIPFALNFQVVLTLSAAKNKTEMSKPNPYR